MTRKANAFHTLMTDRLGFWIDMENPYRTFDSTYIESVWWSLRQLWDKDLLYQGYKVVPYCPRCQTSLSSHELSLGYMENTPDPSVIVKFRLADSDDVSMLAWTTEFMLRHVPDLNQLEGGLYSQLVWQAARRWFLGVRGDWIGLPTSSVLGRTLRAALSLTFQASEFARIRGYAAVENSSSSSDPVSFGGAETASFIPVAQPGTALVAFLQLEISIGAHGAHPF